MHWHSSEINCAQSIKWRLNAFVSHTHLTSDFLTINKFKSLTILLECNSSMRLRIVFFFKIWSPVVGEGAQKSLIFLFNAGWLWDVMSDSVTGCVTAWQCDKPCQGLGDTKQLVEAKLFSQSDQSVVFSCHTNLCLTVLLLPELLMTWARLTWNQLKLHKV